MKFKSLLSQFGIDIVITCILHLKALSLQQDEKALKDLNQFTFKYKTNQSSYWNEMETTKNLTFLCSVAELSVFYLTKLKEN